MLLGLMSIAGTIPLFIYWSLLLFFKEAFPIENQKQFLRLSVLFYLLPVQIIRGWIPEHIYDAITSRAVFSLEDRIAADSAIEIRLGEKFIWIPEWIKYILLIWFVVAFLFASYQILKQHFLFRSVKRELRKKSVKINGHDVEIYTSPEIHVPVSVGLFHSKIVFPEIKFSKTIMDLLYRHEYSHMKHHDALKKTLLLIICVIHWFNPCVWLLLYAYNQLCEYIADEYATKGFSYEIKKEYARILIELSSVRERNMTIVWKNSFSGANNLRRRIDFFMKKTSLSKGKKMFMAIATACAVMMSMGTVLAYTPVQTYERSFEFENDDSYIMTDAMNIQDEIEYVDDFSLSDMIIEFADGSIIPVGATGNSERLFCIHAFTDGYVKTHTGNGNGGCTVVYYTADVCKKCNYAKNIVWYSTTTYATCPH